MDFDEFAKKVENMSQEQMDRWFEIVAQVYGLKPALDLRMMFEDHFPKFKRIIN